MRSTARVLTAAAVLLAAGHASAQTKVWTTTADFNLGTLSNASDSEPGNEVVLGPTPVSQTHTIWTDHFNYGLVLRMDTVSGKQTGRYDSTLTAINGQATGARPPNEFCNWSNTGNCPSRIAVDTNGNAWVVNPAYGNQGTLTEYAGNIASCIDRNNDGQIETSSDVSGDGIIDMTTTLPAAQREYWGQNDECILTTIPVGPSGAMPRSVAIDRWGKIWVSTYFAGGGTGAGVLYRYSPNPPVALEATVPLTGNPFAIATGGGYLLVSANPGPTSRVNITSLAVDQVTTCPATYGIVADPGGQTAWLGSEPANTEGVYLANFTNNTCTFTSNGSSVTAATTLDTQPSPGPYVWAANFDSNTVSKYTMAGSFLGNYAAGTAASGTEFPYGLSPDFQGYLWVVSEVSKVGTTYVQQQMTKFNPSTDAVLGTYFDGFLGGGTSNGTYPVNCSTAATGQYCDPATPYAMGDLTGVQINRQAPYTYVGSWNGVFDGGFDAIPWSNVTWNTESQGSVPQYTTLAVAARAADTLGALGTSSYVAATNGAALGGVTGRYVQVSANLVGPGFVTPVLSDVTVNGPCATSGNSCCLSDSDCNNGDPCTPGTCPTPGGVCVFAPVTGCCMVNPDCNDGNACTTDTCPGAGQQCVFTPINGCCNSDADCDDANPCSADICSGPGGTCSHPIIAGCCLTDLDCTNGNLCSAAVCPAPGGFCQGGMIPGCCHQDSDCTDNNLCTNDTCDISTSTCSNTPIAGCCNTDAECDDDDPCTNDACTGLGGTCTHTPRPSCCVTSADCTGSTLCTTAACSGPGGTCTQTTEANCCMLASDCDDSNLCTQDSCPVPGGPCTHTAVAGCCMTSADCDGGNRCTQADCPTQGGTCTYTPLTGCCATNSDCPATNDCVNGWCAGSAPDAASGGVDAGHDATTRPGSEAGAFDARADSVADARADARTDGAADARVRADAHADARARADAHADARARGDAHGGVDATGNATADAGTAVGSGGGCGCTVPGGKQPGGLTTLAGLLAMALIGVRRRRA